MQTDRGMFLPTRRSQLYIRPTGRPKGKTGNAFSEDEHWGRPTACLTSTDGSTDGVTKADRRNRQKSVFSLCLLLQVCHSVWDDIKADFQSVISKKSCSKLGLEKRED